MLPCTTNVFEAIHNSRWSGKGWELKGKGKGGKGGRGGSAIVLGAGLAAAFGGLKTIVSMV